MVIQMMTTMKETVILMKGPSLTTRGWLGKPDQVVDHDNRCSHNLFGVGLIKEIYHLVTVLEI